MTANFDLDKAKRHNLEQTQVKMDMPTWMVKSIDKEASRVSVHFPQGARASRPLKWRPRWPRSQEKAGGSERLPLNEPNRLKYLCCTSFCGVTGLLGF